MKIEKCVKEAFAVIGKEGSTSDGDGFIQKLWENANSHFNEVQQLAKKDESGNICGIWGANRCNFFTDNESGVAGDDYRS